MNPNTFPTKGNLILAKNSLALAKQGYVLMDKKRNILIRELMDLIDQARDIQSEIDSTFREAYESLQKANIELGINYVQEISSSIPIENGIRIKARSIMGTEIPLRFMKLSSSFDARAMTMQRSVKTYMHRSSSAARGTIVQPPSRQRFQRDTFLIMNYE